MEFPKNDNLLNEVQRGINTRPNLFRNCRRCQAAWVPKSWNFYDLCEECFCEFDKQKMEGRFAVIAAALSKTETEISYFEDSEKWAKQYPKE